MDYYPMTDRQIAGVLGQRLKALRLQQIISQQSLADHTLLSINTIKSAEAGKAKLTTYIALLRELKTLDQIDLLLPEVTMSPLQLVKLQGRQRLKAGGKRVKTLKD